MLTGTHGRPAAGSKALEGVRLCLPEPCAGSAFVGGPGVTVFAFLPLAILQESATRCRPTTSSVCTRHQTTASSVSLVDLKQLLTACYLQKE